MRSTKFAIATSAASKRSPESTTASAGSASITASQVPIESRSPKISSALGAHQRRQRGIELLAAALPRHRGRRLDPADAVRDLDELGDLRDPRRQRDVVALQAARPAAPVPLLVGGAQRRRCTAPGSPSCSRAGRASSACWAIIVVHLAVAGESRTSSPTRKRCSGGLPAPSRRRPAAVGAQARQLVVVLARLQRDVVAEPLRLLVGVGVAADVDEQRRVVDDRPRLLVEPEPLGEPQRDQALPQDVLHRLPETEVDAERERGDQLGQPHAVAIGFPGHVMRRLRCREMRRSVPVQSRSPVARAVRAHARRLPRHAQRDGRRRRPAVAAGRPAHPPGRGGLGDRRLQPRRRQPAAERRVPGRPLRAQADALHRATRCSRSGRSRARWRRAAGR